MRGIYIGLAATLIIVGGWIGFRILELNHLYGKAANPGIVLDWAPSGTQEEPDLTVVLYYNYSCRWCREFEPVFMKAAERDGKVRVVFRPVPYSEDLGEYETRLVYAAALQGRETGAYKTVFTAFHDALIRSEDGTLSPRTVRHLSDAAGLDYARLIEEASSKQVKDALAESTQLVTNLKIYYLPSFQADRIIMNTMGGRPTVESFLTFFDAARKAADR